MLVKAGGNAGRPVSAVETVLRGCRRILMAHELKLRVTVLVVVVVAAYHYSLITLLRQISLDTPLAYLGLVPLIALLLAAAQCWLPSARPDIRDRAVDYIIGLPLLVAALSVILVAPIRLSLLFWFWRLDLLTLPLFIAGAVAILFGVQALWRVRASILFLLLAWPIPHTLLGNGLLSTLTNATVAALNWVTALFTFARPVGGSIFQIAHSGQPFLLSVGSACAGANGILGFLLVAVAFAALLSGPLPLKVLWLGGGVALTWSLNLCRIVLIFGTGQLFGESAAVSGLHPFVGLITFSVGVLLMVSAMHLFRLRVPQHRRPFSRSGLAEASAAPGSNRAVGPWTAAWPLTGMVLVVASGGLLASANASLQHVQLVAKDLGAPRVQETSEQSAGVKGWFLDQIDTYPWADQYFDSGATWARYEYEMQGGAKGAQARSLAYQSPVVMDVITTKDLTTFSTYPVETCYRYRGAGILQTRTVDLGNGVVGHAISSRADGVIWSAVYWEWPIDTGSGVRYERVVLTTSAAGGASVPDPAPPAITQGFGLAQSIGVLMSNGLGDAEGGPARGPQATSQDFLVAFAHAIVQSNAASSTGGGRRPQLQQQSIKTGGV